MKKFFKLPIIKMINLIFINSHVLTAFSLVLSLIMGILPVFEVMVVAGFINSVVSYIGHQTQINEVVVFFVILGIIEMLKLVSPSIQNIFRISIENKSREHSKIQFIEKIYQSSYKYFENSDYQSLFHRVLKEPELQISNQYYNLLHILQIVIQIVGLLIIIAGHSWWAAILVLVIAFPLFKLSVVSGKANYQAKVDTSNEERKSDYFSNMNISREFVDERSVFEFSENVTNRYHESYEIIRKQKNKVELNWFFKMKISGIIVLIFSGFVTVILSFPAIEGKISIGLYIALVNSVSSLAQVISWQLTASLDQYAQDVSYINDLEKVGQITEEVSLKEDNGILPPFRVLEFKNVSFKYLGTESYVLKI